MSLSTTISNIGPLTHSNRRPWLHRYAVFVAICTFVLVLLGSMVTTTDSGLAVPDWPTTYGENMFTYSPSNWVGGIFYEHVHRLVASGVGFLTIILCVWLWRSDHNRSLKWLGSFALLAVCVQGTLGGLTVIFKLPTGVSVAHAGLAEIFLCMVVAIALLTSPSWGRRTCQANHAQHRSLKTHCVILIACIYLQILIGAWTRHTQSGLAITDFPLSYGQLLPPTSQAALDSINEQRVWQETRHIDGLEPVTLGQVWIHFGHRIGALVSVVVFLVCARLVAKRFSDDARLLALSMIIGGLIVCQIVLGAVTIWSERMLAITTAHVGFGALILVCCLAMTMTSFSLRTGDRASSC